MKKILLNFLWVLLLLGTQSFAQTRTVTGTVTGKDDGLPLPGVSVIVKGTKIGTQTSSDGTYLIKVPAGSQSLLFSFVGFTTQTITVGNNPRINVSLSGAASQLNEVVVTGYGTQVKRESVGSIASVKGSAIAQTPIQSFEQGLGGRAAGVQITIPAGVLNTPPVFRVRGTNSISLSSQPLIVVDGQVVITGDVSLSSSAGNALANLNPNDIESIDIAKDAAATAIYGSRAANGVVFITTKKGKAGKPRVSFDTWVGTSEPYRLPKMLDAFQYTDYKNEAVANANAIRAGSAVASAGVPVQFKLTNGPDGNPINTNWFDYVYRDNAMSYNANLSVSGGSDATTYYASFGYGDQKGIFAKNELKRMSGLFNVDSKVNSVVTIGGKLSFSNERNLAAAASGSLNGEAYGTTGLARTALVNAPNISPYNNDGSYNIGATYIGPMNNIAAGNQVGFYNPVYVLNNNRENNENDHIQSNAYLQIKPVSWAALKTSYGIDYINSDNDEFYAPLHGPGQGAAGEATAAFRKYKRWTWTNTAQFTKTFFQKNNFDLLVGQEQQRNTTRGYGIDRQTLSDPAYTVVQAGFTTNNNYAAALTENYLESIFGRLNYNFDQKYFLTGNIRQDNYSALGIKKGTFYGVGAGWELSREKFWTSMGLDKTFTTFRLKGSYGKVGNVAGIGDFASFSTFGSGLYGGASTLSFSSAGNKTLQWETSKKTDIGLTWGMFNDRLTGELTYYNTNVDGLILNVPQIPSAGLPSTTIAYNAGSMYNRGVEFTLGGTPITSKAFTWNSNFNIAYNKNQVTKLADGLTEILTVTGTTATGESPSRTAPGYSLGYLYVVRTGGVDPQTGRRIFYNGAGRAVTYQHITGYVSGNSGATLPQWTYLDNGATAPAITQSADAKMYKNTIPKIVGGFDNNFRYKGFDLDVLLTYQLGFWVYYGTNAGLHDQRYWNNTTDVLQRWTKPGDITNFVRPIYGDNVSYGNTIPIDFNVFKGDFVKFKNVTLGYTIPKTLVSKAGLTNVRVYVSGQNLAMITKYPGPDPEVASNGTTSSGQGTDRNGGPNARTLTVGLNVGF